MQKSLRDTIEEARQDLARLRGGRTGDWRALIERALAEAQRCGDLDALAETVQFMTYMFDSEGRFGEALLEIQHAERLTHNAPAARGLLTALEAAMLSAMGRSAETRQAVEISEGLLAHCEAPTRKWLALIETVRLKLLLEPSARLEGLLSACDEPGAKAEHLVALSWYVPYLAARGHRGAGRPLIRQGQAIAASLDHRWRISDMEAFDGWKRAVEGVLPTEAPGRAISHQARWRAATLWLWSVSMRRDLAAADEALAGISAAHAKQGSADVGPLEAWEAWGRALVGDNGGLPRLHPPQDTTLVNLGAWIAAANTIAIVGSRSDAAVWLPWVRKLAALGVESSMEWPVWRRRIEALLVLRTGKVARARNLMAGAADAATTAGYVIEAAIARVQLAEMAAVLAEGERGPWQAGADEARTALLDMGIDPLPHVQAVQGALLEAQTREQAVLTPREIEALRLFAEGLSYRQAAERLGLSWQTVRTMARNIYEKLGVSGKHAAAQRGRELRLL
jgi:DNA-binding CsgD family transcriptional regulator